MVGVVFCTDNSIENSNRSYYCISYCWEKTRTEYRINMSACQNKHHTNNNITAQNQIVPSLGLLYLNNLHVLF